MTAVGQCLSVFICYEKKKQKYVSNTDFISRPYKRLEYFVNSCRTVLTIVPILLALTAEGIGDDIYAGLSVLESPKQEDLI